MPANQRAHKYIELFVLHHTILYSPHEQNDCPIQSKNIPLKTVSNKYKTPKIPKRNSRIKRITLIIL